MRDAVGARKRGKAAVWAQPAEPSNAYRRFNVVFGCRPL